MTKLSKTLTLTLLLVLAGCSNDENIPGQYLLTKLVENNRVGEAADQWIEMKNFSNEWERTGLVFGYTDDYEECLKAIQGLKQVNYAREYRCAPAN